MENLARRSPDGLLLVLGFCSCCPCFGRPWFVHASVARRFCRGVRRCTETLRRLRRQPCTSPAYRLRSRISYITGMKISVSMVENTMPPITAIAIGERISAPSPQPSAIGTSPSTLLSIVIRIGRSRTSPATFSASRFEYPSVAKLVGIVDQHDRVVDDDADQNDDSEQHHHADRGVGDQRGEHHADQDRTER